MNYQTDNNFWFDCWKNNKLGFNQQAPNPTLIEFFSTFSIPKKVEPLFHFVEKAST